MAMKGLAMIKGLLGIRWFLGLFIGGVIFLMFPPLQGREDEAALIKFFTPAEGYRLSIAARDLPSARLMALTSERDVIVSQGRTGRISLVPFADTKERDGPKAQLLLKGLDHPHGLALDGSWLYIAEETEVVRYPFDAKARKITGPREVLFKGMPAGGHATRTIRKGPDGSFYVSVGSSCNVCIERHPWRAALLKFKPGEKPQLYATGLRNTVGYDWHPVTDALYGVDNGRDWLGDELPPEEVNHIIQGGFYGWPFFYGANVRDLKFGGRYDDAVHGKPVAPVHEMRAHVAPLSLRFLKQRADKAPVSALVTQHGSWNRSSKIGYKVIQLTWNEKGRITQLDFLTGFLQGGRVIGRPVDTLELDDGSVLISDDRLGLIWKMEKL